MKRLFVYSFFVLMLLCNTLFAKNTKYRIAMDVSHNPVFWNDPSDMKSQGYNQLDRVKYMTGQLSQNAASLDASIVYLKKEITPADLKDIDLLFIHIPKAQYTKQEIKTIVDYIKDGGSLFLVMDDDYWSSLDDTNVNDIIAPFDIQFGLANQDTVTGGHSKAGIITTESLKLSYHQGRSIKGGTPFCYSDQSDDYPFGVYKKLKNGGRIIVMGDGMTSLYMTSWAGVNDYQCSEFMRDVLRWLLK